MSIQSLSRKNKPNFISPDPTISYRKQSDRHFLVKSLSLLFLPTFKEENTMKMNLNEMEACMPLVALTAKPLLSVCVW